MGACPLRVDEVDEMVVFWRDERAASDMCVGCVGVWMMNLNLTRNDTFMGEIPCRTALVRAKDKKFPEGSCEGLEPAAAQPPFPDRKG